MEYLRAHLVQGVINSYDEIQIPTPTSKTENMAMLIHTIDLHPSALIATAPANADTVHAHLATRARTVYGTIEMPEILAKYKVYTALNAVFNGTIETGQQQWKFDPPILCPKTLLYAGIQSTGFASAVNLDVRVGYTLEKVSREDFISALVE
ncbi:hypothetical protein ES705_43379 [subsurface metagenome]